MKLYLDVERTRFGEKLQTEFEIPDHVKEVQLPPLLLQPLVEKRHETRRFQKAPTGARFPFGANAADGVGSIVVRNETPASGLLSGAKQNRPCFGLGLKNVKERLKVFFDGAASLKIVEETDLSFAVELRFPILAEGGAHG